MKIKDVALIGMGAIGTVYGKLLHDHFGEHFAVVAGGSRGKRLRHEGVTLNGKAFYPRVVAPGEDGFVADLILFSVKNNQLPEAIADVRAFVGGHTVLLPLLNGVSARDVIAAAYPANKTLYGFCLAIDALRDETGVINTIDGHIQFGEADNTKPAEDVLAVRQALADSGIDARVTPDMILATWRKWMINVGCNQVSAVTGANYGQMRGISHNHDLLFETMMEIVALANAAGIALTEQDALDFDPILAALSPQGKTSMLQDIEGKRKTEVDCFAGAAIALGKRYGVPMPVNHVLYHLIKAIEEKF